MVDESSLHCFGFVGLAVLRLWGFRFRIQVLWYAPAWTLPQVVQAALPEMSRVAIYRSFSSLGYQIFVCVWDSTFRERHFRLDPDYAHHPRGGRWDEGAAGCVGHLKRGLLWVLGKTYMSRSEIFLWRRWVWLQMDLQILLDFLCEIISTLGYIC